MIGDFLCVCPITWTGTLCEERVEQCEEEIKQLPFLKSGIFDKTKQYPLCAKITLG